jgi:hypothetical protein
MKLFGKEQFVMTGCFSALLSLSGCGGAETVCGSVDIRNSVVKIIANDTSNALINYAVKNSSAIAAMVGDTKSEAEKVLILEKARRDAVYALDDTISVESRARAAHGVTCIGLLEVTVSDTTAQKELEFRVEQTTNGKMLVTVSPFLF